MEYVTTNVRLRPGSYQRMKLLSVEEHKSLAQLIREAVEHTYGVARSSKKSVDWHKDPFFKGIGICATGIKDGAVLHDRDIYGVNL
jgi:hypothetical protein